MKKNYTLLWMIRSAWILFLFFGSVASSFSQKSHHVEVTNNIFTPEEVTISPGDTVIWTNTQGNHDVNGTQASYPSNPESFGNDLGVGWVYSHVFSLSGEYDYHCNPHLSFGMVGKVIVEESGSTLKVNPNGMTPYISVYPNPATDLVSIATGGNIESVSIISVAGVVLKTFGDMGTSDLTVQLDGFGAGIYFLEVRTEDHSVQIIRLLKQ